AWCAGTGRSADPATGQCPGHQYRCGSREGDAGGLPTARHRAGPADRAVGQLADDTQLLAEPTERSQLSAGDRDASIPGRLAPGTQQHTAEQQRHAEHGDRRTDPWLAWDLVARVAERGSVALQRAAG